MVIASLWVIVLLKRVMLKCLFVSWECIWKPHYMDFNYWLIQVSFFSRESLANEGILLGGDSWKERRDKWKVLWLEKEKALLDKLLVSSLDIGILVVSHKKITFWGQSYEKKNPLILFWKVKIKHFFHPIFFYTFFTTFF